MSSTTTVATEGLLGEIAMLRKFIPPAQMSVILGLMIGAEGEFFREKMQSLAALVRSMPMTRGTEDTKDPIVHLHYFRGSVDVFVTERDVGDGTGEKGLGAQHQAFGYVDLGYGAELGYISLPELFRAGVELDLHWTPKPVSQVLKEHAARMAA
jgi:hypothetical protein